jgi:hypothetical protein
MSQIVVSSGTTSVSTVDASNSYLDEMQGTLVIFNGGLVSGVTVGQDFELGGVLVESSGGRRSAVAASRKTSGRQVAQ